MYETIVLEDLLIWCKLLKIGQQLFKDTQIIKLKSCDKSIRKLEESIERARKAISDTS